MATIAKTSSGSTWAKFEQTTTPSIGTFKIALSAGGSFASPVATFEAGEGTGDPLAYEFGAVSGLLPRKAYKVQFFPRHFNAGLGVWVEDDPSNVVTFITSPYSPREAVYAGLDPLAWWRLDDEGGTEDASGNGADLELEIGGVSDSIFGPRRPALAGEGGFSYAWGGGKWGRVPHAAWMERERTDGWVIVARCYANASGLHPLMSYGDPDISAFAWTVYSGPNLAIDAAGDHYEASGVVEGLSLCIFLISEERFAIWQDGVLVLDVEPSPHYIPPRLSMPAQAEDTFKVALGGYASYGYFYGGGSTDYDHGNLDEVAVYPLLTDEEIGMFFDPPALPEISDCGEGLRLTFFENDDITPILGELNEDGSVAIASFYTSPNCPRPHLKMPGPLSKSEVDFRNGKSVIGGMNVEVIDYPTDPDDQLSGIVTSIIDKLPYARALLEQWIAGDIMAWLPVFDGVNFGDSIDQRLVTYKGELRDIREREVGAPLFDRNETMSLYPTQGPVDAFLSANGQQLYPAASVGTGQFVLQGVSDESGRKHGFIHTGKLFEERLTGPDSPWVEIGRSHLVGDVDGAMRWEYDQVAVKWRPVGGTDDDWTVLRNMHNADPVGANHSGTMWSAFYQPTTRNGKVLGPVEIYLEAREDLLPPDSATVEYMVITSGDPSEFAPVYFEGTFGQLLKNIYDGVYSITAPRIRYDEDAMADFVGNTPIARMMLTELVDDMRSWVEENIYKPLGAAPIIDEYGRVRPVYSRVPSLADDLPVLDNDNITIDTDWQRKTEDAVSEVEFDYERAYLAESTDSGNKTTTSLARRPVIQIFRNLASRLNKPATYKPATLLALGTRNTGEAVAGIESEVGSQLARARAAELLPRFPQGSQTTKAVGDPNSEAVKSITSGAWRRVRMTWLPDTTRLVRTMDRAVQVVNITIREDGFRILTLLDGGSTDDTLVLPTVAPLAYDDDARVIVDITDVPAGETARVDYAFAATEPDEEDPAWTFLTNPSAPATVKTPIVPDGMNVYVRYRGEAAGKRPTDWAPVLTIAPSTLPALTDVTVTVDPIDGFGSVGYWGRGAPVKAVKIWWEDHLIGVRPTFPGAPVEVGPDNDVYGIGEFDQNADPLRQLSVKVEPWDAYPTSTPGAQHGAAVIASAVYGSADASTIGALPFFDYLGVRDDIPLQDTDVLFYDSDHVRHLIPVVDYRYVPFVDYLGADQELLLTGHT